MDINEINHALARTYMHIRGKRAFLEAVSTAEVQNVQIHSNMMQGSIEHPLYGECKISLSLTTAAHSEQDILDYVKDGIVPHNPILRFMVIMDGDAIFCTEKEVQFNDLPWSVVDYLHALYCTEHKGEIGAALYIRTEYHDYSTMQNDFSTLLRTWNDGYSTRLKKLAFDVTTWDYNNANLCRTKSLMLDNYVDLQRYKIAGHLAPEGWDGEYAPLSEDSVFNMQLLGYEESIIFETLSRVTLMPPDGCMEVQDIRFPYFFAEFGQK